MRLFLLILPWLIAPALTTAWAQDTSHKPVDQLLAALKAAPSEEVAAPLESRIQHIWLDAGSPAVRC